MLICQAMIKDDLATRLFRAYVPFEWPELCMFICHTAHHFIVVCRRKERDRERQRQREKEHLTYIANIVGHHPDTPSLISITYDDIQHISHALMHSNRLSVLISFSAFTQALYIVSIRSTVFS